MIYWPSVSFSHRGTRTKTVFLIFFSPLHVEHKKFSGFHLSRSHIKPLSADPISEDGFGSQWNRGAVSKRNPVRLHTKQASSYATSNDLSPPHGSISSGVSRKLTTHSGRFDSTSLVSCRSSRFGDSNVLNVFLMTFNASNENPKRSLQTSCSFCERARIRSGWF